MSIETVKVIMGVPDDSLSGYFDESKIMYLYELGSLESSDIEIYFDSLTKVVTHVILPKGE